MLQVLERLAAVDPWELSPADRLFALADWERVSAWVEARKAACLAAAAAPDPDKPVDSEDWTREEVAVALTISPAAAHRRIEHARALDGPLLAARDAMQAGRLSPIQAAALVEETALAGDEVRRRVAPLVLDRAPELTPGRFRAAVRRAVIAADPAGAAERRDRAREGRRVVHWPEPDGMATFCATLTAEDDAAVWQALTSLAQTWTADGRSLDQCRADALVGLITGQASLPDQPNPPGSPFDPSDPSSRSGRSGRSGGGRAVVNVLIDLPTALGLADNPVTLPGYGPLPPAVGRALAHDGDWQRWITDPRTGELLDLGRTRYRPSPRLAAFIRARDRRCRFPGCTTPARRTDIDHNQAYDTGGRTDRHNLLALCRRHHRLKTFTRWTYQRHPDGTIEWTDPHGHTWHDPPDRE